MPVERLRRRKDIQQLFISGQVVSNRIALIRYLITELTVARAAIAPGKRLDKRAVVRNKVRRRMREALKLLPIVENVDFVIVPRAEALNLTPVVLARRLKPILDEAGLLEEGDNACLLYTSPSPRD